MMRRHRKGSEGPRWTQSPVWRMVAGLAKGEEPEVSEEEAWSVKQRRDCTTEEVGSREGEAPGGKPLGREEEFAWPQRLSPSSPREVQYLQALFPVGSL